MKEDKHTLTMTSGRSDLEEASFPVNSSVQAIGQCYRLHQPEVSASRETPRLTRGTYTPQFIGVPVADDSTLRIQ